MIGVWMWTLGYDGVESFVKLCLFSAVARYCLDGVLSRQGVYRRLIPQCGSDQSAP